MIGVDGVYGENAALTGSFRPVFDRFIGPKHEKRTVSYCSLPPNPTPKLPCLSSRLSSLPQNFFIRPLGRLFSVRR